MKAVCWMGTSKVETLTVADPRLLNPRDAIVKITKDRDLWIRSPFVRWLYPDDGSRRCPWT